MPVRGTELNASVSTYQGIDGSNTTVAGIEDKILGTRGTASVFMGIGTDFDSYASYVVDFKGSYNYDKNGIIGQNLRVRNNIKTNKHSTTQVRYSPLTVNVPVGDKTSLYVNPHYSGTYDYKSDKWTNSAGVFAGVTQKLGSNTSISLEAQRYNLHDIKDNSSKNWSVNAIVTYKF